MKCRGESASEDLAEQASIMKHYEVGTLSYRTHGISVSLLASYNVHKKATVFLLDS
jgi:hypothetical protein